MSGKQDKKLRQLYRKDYSQRVGDTMKELREELQHIHKPAPWFIPNKVWRRLGRIFLNI